MEKFIALIQLFTLLKVEFQQISPNEIVLECPCDIVNDFSKVDLCQDVIINDPTTCGDRMKFGFTFPTMRNTILLTGL